MSTKKSEKETSTAFNAADEYDSLKAQPQYAQLPKRDALPEAVRTRIAGFRKAAEVRTFADWVLRHYPVK